MRIFIGYGFNDRDKWIEKYVFPIVEAFGDTVVEGKEVYGQIISQGVKRRIESCDGMIGFLTRREASQGGRWTTHRWVQDELMIAHEKMPILEVREIGIDPQRGYPGDRQPIEYDENARDKCLVELVKAIGDWHRRSNVELRLLPGAFVEDIRPILKRPGFNCTYFLMEGDDESQGEATVKPIKGGLFIRLKEVSRDALVQINVKAEGRSWTSDYEPVNTLNVQMSEDS